MATAEDFLNDRYADLLDREIMLELYKLRGSKLSSEEIQNLCGAKSLYAGKEKKYSIRSIESHLQALKERGDVETATKAEKVGRPRKLFAITNKCLKELETYIRTPRLSAGYAMGGRKD